MGLLSVRPSDLTPEKPRKPRKRWLLFLQLFTLTLCALVTIVSLAFNSLFGIEGYFTPYPAIDTYFPPGYDEEKFLSIQPGDSQAHVFELLGEPLERAGHLGVRGTWIYSQDGAFGWWDFAWLFRSVEFDAEGNVLGLRIETHYD